MAALYHWNRISDGTTSKKYDTIPMNFDTEIIYRWQWRGWPPKTHPFPYHITYIC